MENKKFKNIHDQYVEFQKQNALNALKQSVYNYLWVVGNDKDVSLTNASAVADIIVDIVEEFYKISE